MKLLKRKNFQALIYAIFISLPMLSILPSTIYFAFNHEASNYTHEEVITTYEYETNEVNSASDLVEGNIYKYDITLSDINNWFNDNPNSTDFYLFSQTKGIYKFYYDDTNYLTMYSDTNSLQMFYRKTNTTIYLYNGYNYNSFLSSNVPTPEEFNFYIIYGGTNATTDRNVQYISESDYLGEKTITIEPVETEGLYNMAYHFLYSRIYTNTELQSMETTLFGTTINMNMWLSHTTAIIIICLLLIVLIKFVIWLFKIVSGGMLWQ